MSEAKALARFKAFQGRAAKDGEVTRVKMKGEADVLLVGELQGLIYKAQGDGVTYIHRFKKTARPVLYVSADGSQVYVLAGAYRFTDRGFEDVSQRGASRPRSKKK